MKKIFLLCYTLCCSWFTFATEYTTPQTGPKTFENGDTVNVTGGSVTAVKDTTVGSAGIHVNNNGAINISAVGANATTSVAISLSNQVANDLGTGSTIQATNNTSNFTAALDIYGKNSSLTATDLTIKANSSNGAAGVNMRDGSTVELKGDNTINVVNGVGIRMNNNTTDVASFKTDKVNIESTGVYSTGIIARGNNFIDLGDGSRIHMTSMGTSSFSNAGIDVNGGKLVAKNLTVIADVDDPRGYSSGIRAQNANVELEGGTIITHNGSALEGKSGSVISAKDITITTTAEGTISTAVRATGGASINANNLTITGSGRIYGVSADGGKVSLTGNTVINSDFVAIRADGMNGEAIVDTGATGSKMTLKGTILAQRAGIMDLTMLAGSTFTGDSTIDNDSSTIKLNMAETTWNVTDNSQVTDLAANNSAINFVSTANNYHTLNVKNLSGNNSKFAMNVDLGGITAAPNTAGERVGQAGVNGDLLTVTNSMGAGNHQLAITNNGAAQTQGNEVLQVVSTPNNNTGNFKLTGPVEAGAYEYGLRQSADASNNKTGWELYSTGQRTSTAQAATSFLNTNYLLSYVDTQTLLQRMGELRSGADSNKQGDFWIRGFGGKLNSFGGQQLSGFDMTYTGTQLGIDKQLDSQLGKVYVGVMAGMTHANPNYRDGDGTTKDYHVGLYGTLITDNGLYVDAVAKYTYLKNHFSVKDTQGNSVQGKGTSSGYNLSLETGKRFHLSAANQSGFYVEPQAQITYGHQGGMSINASNGLKVDLGNYNYTLGRMSGIVGYEIAGANPVNLYVKTGYVREMDGSTSYKLNGQKSDYNARGGWWDNGVGVTAQFNKRHNIYADINYAKGSRFDQKQLNVGYRYSF